MKNNSKCVKKRMQTSKMIKTFDQNQANMSLPGFNGARSRSLIWNNSGYYPQKFSTDLFRFLRDNIPILNACIWTWSRLCSAPGKFKIDGAEPNGDDLRALDCLNEMSLRIYPFSFQKTAGLESFMPLLFSSLFTDGAFAGFVILRSNMGGIEKFQPIDPSAIASVLNMGDDIHLVMQTDKGEVKIEGEDFYYFGLDPDQTSGLGRSILKSVPFVSYIEQQLVDDMRRTIHNAGYHRLHVQITPPEKLSGESDNAYVDRVNEYFDETVSMIKTCEIDENPVTWDNVKIEYIGPRNVVGATNSWFFNHRAMIEEVCAGTNLAPFMLGYSYGTTHNWAQFKYDLVMRQVVSIQRQTARFLEWLGNIELALNGFKCKCRFSFDNSLTYAAGDRADIEKSRVDNLIKLYSAGLISKDEASQKAGEFI